jgi:aminoglycoside phosphotransferase family enzyme/predicted kinase
MDLPELLAALSDPAAYPRPGPVEVRQTHISAVFLVGDTVYKIRKPVNLGFVDFSTLAKRKHDCEEEVRLNRRLAPSVYRGLVPITIEGDEITPEQIEMIARRVAAFHRIAEHGEHVSRFGRFDVVAGNARENFDQTVAHIGVTVRPVVYERVRELSEKALVELKPLIESRAARGVPCDTHGDLHLSHIYLFPDRPPPDDLVIIDCIEFAERYRFADPVADIAFLVMDVVYHGRGDLARACADAYFAAAGDEEGRALLPFYVAYRAVVRAKVKGIQVAEQEIPSEQRTSMALRAEAHWLLALGALEEPARRPALVLIGGLPGTGKSTLARGLLTAANFTVIRSDQVRKELAGVPLNEKGDGFYTPEWTGRTYSECIRRAETILRTGGRVIVDATFAYDAHRAAFQSAGQRLGVPVVSLVCRADSTVVRERLRTRRGDISDADERVYDQMKAQWRPAANAVEVDTSDSARALETAITELRRCGLE